MTSKPPEPAPLTEGLTSLDRDRAASVADEGGGSAAHVEAEDPTSAGAKPDPARSTIEPDGKDERRKRRRSR